MVQAIIVRRGRHVGRPPRGKKGGMTTGGLNSWEKLFYFQKAGKVGNQPLLAKFEREGTRHQTVFAKGGMKGTLEKRIKGGFSQRAKRIPLKRSDA